MWIKTDLSTRGTSDTTPKSSNWPELEQKQQSLKHSFFSFLPILSLESFHFQSSGLVKLWHMFGTNRCEICQHTTAWTSVKPSPSRTDPWHSHTRTSTCLSPCTSSNIQLMLWQFPSDQGLSLPSEPFQHTELTTHLPWFPESQHHLTH